MDTLERLNEWQVNLPDHYRDRFLLKYSLGLTNEEIGACLDLTVSGVKQRLTRGKEMPRQALEKRHIIARGPIRMGGADIG